MMSDEQMVCLSSGEANHLMRSDERVSGTRATTFQKQKTTCGPKGFSAGLVYEEDYQRKDGV